MARVKKVIEEPIVKDDVVLDEINESEVVVEAPESLTLAAVNNSIGDVSLYTIEAADLNAYPELSQQGVQLYDEVAYGSLTVNKYSSGSHDSFVSEAWPRRIHSGSVGMVIKP